MFPFPFSISVIVTYFGVCACECATWLKALFSSSFFFFFFDNVIMFEMSGEEIYIGKEDSGALYCCYCC